ncbi:MAG TPA: AAA family ATPase [Thermoanaerobaculia bacterium]|nr:AAA family ATPase [Thermoanaerobaculia bacterium]
MFVRSLHLSNLRCFQEAEVELQYPGREQDDTPEHPNVNLLLGINGSGKTTLLKAISLAVLGRILPSSGFVPYHLVRRGPGRTPGESAAVEARLVLHGQDRPGATDPGEMRARVRIERLGSDEELVFKGVSLNKELHQEDSPAFLLVGYGATRWVVGASQFEPVSSQRKRRRLRYQRVAGLFEEHIGLTPLNAWLPEIQSKDAERFEEVGSLLGELLPEGLRFLGEMEDGEYLFEHSGVTVPLGALSDGYRAYIGWITDLLSHLAAVTPQGGSLRGCHGVTLVDEIDLHLHPTWQREVVPTIARALPNLQFVLTTHSPIVAGTLHRQNIYVVEMQEDGASTVRQLRERIHGLNADQVLVSSYFNLETTRAATFEDDLRSLSRRAMEGDEDAAVAYLRKLAAESEDETIEVPAEA